MNKQWSKNIRDLLSQMLEKDLEIRMKHAENIKKHPWFGMINWDDLLAKKVKPPFVPVLNGDNDVSNFAAEFTKCSLNSINEGEDCSNYEGFSYERSSPPTSPMQMELLKAEEEMAEL